jgi:hypothetical protein
MSVAQSEEAEAGLGLPIAIFASAQFVMSISQIVADLDTTIAGVQLAITAHTLVMAALVMPAIVSLIAVTYGDAQLQGLKRAIGAVGVFAVLALLWFTRGLPGRPPGLLESASLAEAS